MKLVKSIKNSTTKEDKKGNLVLTSYPSGATIKLDGMLIVYEETKEPLKTPMKLELSEGLHDIVFKLEGYCDEFATVYISSGLTQNINKTLNVC